MAPGFHCGRSIPYDLGRHVLQRPDFLAPGVVTNPHRHSKITQLDRVVRAQEDVRQLQVPVHKAVIVQLLKRMQGVNSGPNILATMSFGGKRDFFISHEPLLTSI